MPDNANQQTFVIHKAEVSPPFLQIGIDNWMEVHRELGTGAAFSLWLWYASNADGFKDDIYPVNIIQDLKMGKQSYYNARDKLIHYGYLIVDKERNYEYHYYEKNPIRNEWRRKIKKNCSDEKELQVFYKDLIHKNIDIDDMTIDEWWLYNRGKKNNWDIGWSF